MLQFCSNTWSDIREWKDETTERLQRSENIRYYTQDRAVLKGLPVAVISSIAAAYLFNCSTLVTGAIFGTVNYLTLTTLLEVIRNVYEIDNKTGAFIIGISSAISLALVRNVCRTPLSIQAAVILSVAAFAGQLLRLHVINKQL